MRKAIRNAGLILCTMFLSACLFYCMVAGAGTGKGAIIYVILAAIMAIMISVTICWGICYIHKLQERVKELEKFKNSQKTEE